jgi:hypothetical protein
MAYRVFNFLLIAIPAIVANHQLDARIADLSAEQRSGPS